MADKYWEVVFVSKSLQVPGKWSEDLAKKAMIQATTDYINNHIRMVEPVEELPADIQVTFGLETEDDGAVPQTAEGID